MSDIQELIHKTSMDCIEKGKSLEQERIIKQIELIVDTCDSSYVAGLYKALALIKGETNG